MFVEQASSELHSSLMSQPHPDEGNRFVDDKITGHQESRVGLYEALRGGVQAIGPIRECVKG